ncbi:MAG: glycosyltransferase family 4 protein [Flavobacteriales bacterium]
MKVGIFLPEVKNPTVGGVYYYNITLLKNLLSQKSIHQFCIIANKESDVPREFIREIGNPELMLINQPGFKFKVYQLLRKLASTKFFPALNGFYTTEINKMYTQVLKEKGVDFIYYITEGQCVSASIPFAANVWDLGHFYIPFFNEIAGDGEFEKRHERFSATLPKAAVIFTESQQGRRDTSFYYRVAEEKIEVLPLFSGPVIYEKTNPEEEENFLAKHSLKRGRYFFYPAQFWPHKNHYSLIEAMKIIHDESKVDDVQLVLTGADKGIITYLRKTIADFGLADRVKILGFVSLRENYILYKNALALTQVTFLGPTNIPLIEAALLGCPVICSDFGGHREQIGDGNALFINPYEVRTIAAAMQEMANDRSKREALIASARQYVVTGKNNVDYCSSVIIKYLNRFEAVKKSIGPNS